MLKKSDIAWLLFYGAANAYNLFQAVLSYVLDREPGTTIYYWVASIVVALLTVVFVYFTWKAAKIDRISLELDTISAYKDAVIDGQYNKFWDDYQNRIAQVNRIYPWSK